MNEWFRKKKITAVIITAVCGAAALFVAAMACLELFVTEDCAYNESLDANWGIVIPPESGFAEEYEQDSGVTFLGDGTRYHVFSYEYDYPIKDMLVWREEQDRTRWHNSYSSAVNEWLSEIGVPRDKYPDCDECVFWYQTSYDYSEIILLWNKSEKKIYAVESFL